MLIQQSRAGNLEHRLLPAPATQLSEGLVDMFSSPRLRNVSTKEGGKSCDLHRLWHGQGRDRTCLGQSSSFSLSQTPIISKVKKDGGSRGQGFE